MNQVSAAASNVHFADRLHDAMRRKQSVLCVGLDPVLGRLPKELLGEIGPAGPVSAEAAAAALKAFSIAVLDATMGHTPVVKPQSACFERYLWHGVKAYHEVIAAAKARGLLVIADAKRGDIGVSSDHYAASQLADIAFADIDPTPGPDGLTVNGYMGMDAVKPFIDTAARDGKGLFVLVRTSNPGSDAVQSHTLADGRSVAEAVARMVADAGEEHLGECGYSLLGAVVGATKPQDMTALRRVMPKQVFLVPVFGAQGAGADDVRAAFDEGRGAVVNASRSVIYAYEKSGGDDWRGAIRQAAADNQAQLNAILG